MLTVDYSIFDSSSKRHSTEFPLRSNWALFYTPRSWLPLLTEYFFRYECGIPGTRARICNLALNFSSHQWWRLSLIWDFLHKLKGNISLKCMHIWSHCQGINYPGLSGRNTEFMLKFSGRSRVGTMSRDEDLGLKGPCPPLSLYQLTSEEQLWVILQRWSG